MTKINEISKKNEIIKAAEKLFVQYSYDGVSMSDIAQKTDITKAALYHHFKDKHDLFCQILLMSVSEFGEQVDKIINKKTGLEKKLKELISLYSNLSVHKMGALRLFVNLQSSQEEKIANILFEKKMEIIKKLEPFAKEIHSHKKLDKDVNPQLIILLIVGMLSTLFCMQSGECQHFIKNTNSNELKEQLVKLILS